MRPAGRVLLGPFLLDAAEARLTRDGDVVPLTGRPLEVLALLAANPGRLLSKNDVLDTLWGHRHISEAVLKTAVFAVRKALGDDAQRPVYVETVQGRGYRLVVDVHPAPLAARPHTTTASPAAPAAQASPQPVGDATLPPGRAPQARLAAEAITLGNLPAQADWLVGRADDLEQLRSMMGTHRLVTITGLGGVGKTRLALAAAAEAAAPSDGAWLLRLDDLADAALVVPTLASMLHLGTAAAASAPALARSLAGQQLLLVLDNAEHLHEVTAELARAVLAVAPGVQLLVTSQLPLRLGAERVLALAPLALPAVVADLAPPPDGYAAAQLLCMRITQQRSAWRPTPADYADIAAICRTLDGVPLALELAAARVPLLGLAGVRKRLHDRFALLTRGAADAANRHRTLAAALDWTFSLLRPHERSALHRLAVFSGGFRFEDADGVLQGLSPEMPLDVVDELLARSLLVAEHNEGASPRLRLFDSVRSHALAELVASGQEADARRRHLEGTFKRFENLHRTDLFVPMQQWMPPLRADVDNLRAALHHGLAEGAPIGLAEQGLRLLAHSMMFWLRSGARAEASRWQQQALQRQAEHGAALGDELNWWLDFATCQLSLWGQTVSPDIAWAAAQRASSGAQKHGDSCGRYIVVYLEFHAALRRGLPLDGSHAQRAADALQPDWPPLARRFLVSVEGLQARVSGDHERYCHFGERLVQLCRQANAHFEAAVGEAMVGQSLMLRGHLDQACAAYFSAAASLRAQGLLREQVNTLAMAAALHLRRGLDARSLSLASEALRLLAAEGMVWWMADSLPWAAWHDGRAEDARRLVLWADQLADSRKEMRGPIFAGMRADIQAALGANAEAVPDWEIPSGEGAAVDLALGPGTWASLVPSMV